MCSTPIPGRRLDLDDPQPDQITVEDIAVTLSPGLSVRAQATRFYFVAQHAIFIAELVRDRFGRPDLAAWALHHDSHEADTCDMPRPLKLKLRADGLTDYDDVSDDLDRVIAEAFDLSPPGKDWRGKASSTPPTTSR